MRWKRLGVCAAAWTVALLWASASFAADARDPFPEIQPSTRAEAVAFLSRSGTPARSLTPAILSAHRDALGLSPSIRRALSLLERRVTFAREQTVVAADGTAIRFTTDPTAFDAIDPRDVNGDGRADVLAAVLAGLDEARRLLGDGLAMPAPEIEVILAELDGRVDGYLVPGRRDEARATLVVEASPAGGAETVRRTIVRETAHATALALYPRYSPGWVEALGAWAVLTTAGDALDTASADVLSRRAARMAEGLVAEHDGLAAGNALWFAFLDEYFGRGAVAAAVEELGKGGPVATALDRAVRRAGSGDLASALREFHLWTVLLGSRDDGHHFSFASRLAAPAFASEQAGLPALSVQTDPAVSPLGTVQVRLSPEGAQGGMRVQFEGEFAARWDVDLILLRKDGVKHRVPVSLTDGRADHTVPAGNVREAWLLIRNLGSDADGPRRYSYTAQHEQGFPFDLAAFEAAPADTGSGVLLAWETVSEQRLFAFNVLRTREEGGQTVTVNPVWIPALGGPTTATSYRFVDRSARPGVAYVYTLQGITADGLTSEAGSATIRTAAER